MLILLCTVSCVAIVYEVYSLATYSVDEAVRPSFSAAGREARVFVIDAGHGGEDGGAVSAGGVPESGLNLSIAARLDALLAMLGEQTVMTRSEDVSIYSDGAASLREKKASDLKNRVALVNDTAGALLVSIHQNSMPSVPSVRGAQVFYGKVSGSDTLAMSVQEMLNSGVNEGREKHEKQIDPSIYLMKHVNCPALLVECGFLSNEQDARALQEDGYQERLSVLIAAGLMRGVSML